MLTHLAAFCAIASLGFQDNKPGVVQQGVSWIQGAWTTVQKQGKPAAEKLVREFPERFKAVPKRIGELHKRYGKSIADLKLEEKKAMIQELWRVRQSINLMALLDSGMLEQLTGIDSKMLKAAQQQVASLTQSLAKK
ncbi:MAG: hypothetical protein ACAH95_13845 [Fimbriimonas sp.]